MKKEKEKLTIESISYVHDPDAAKVWFELYIEMIKKQILNQVQQKSD